MKIASQVRNELCCAFKQLRVLQIPSTANTKACSLHINLFNLICSQSYHRQKFLSLTLRSNGKDRRDQQDPLLILQQCTDITVKCDQGPWLSFSLETQSLQISRSVGCLLLPLFRGSNEHFKPLMSILSLVTPVEETQFLPKKFNNH